ncbi:A-kinase anchor protein 12 [Collichthys lucidus]|uniref:A-kinase anchor protein 12 n=1 Tax=Collichthys lucidus TaxID=240159 RepID=A0A4V6ATE7_COLLU|nr:A-kinase anchor protein 12 [Collichthys lucidus]
MGDAQSAQREDKRDAAAEEESGKVDDAPAEENIEAKPLINNGQISEISGKADGSIAEVNGHCEDKIAAEANLSPDEDVLETEKPLQEEEEEEAPLENVEINEKESPNEADDNEDAEIIEMDAKQNDINEGFKRFFSNIGLKLTVKRGSETAKNVQDETDKEEANTAEDVEDAAKETKSENAEENTDVNVAQETDNDSTTCPTLTDATSEDIRENAEEEKATETQEKVESDNAEEAATTPPPVEDAHPDATAEEEPRPTSPSSPEEEVVVSPIKRFFTTGIFSGLRKKKKAAEDETADKELVDMGKKEVTETTEQAAQDQQQNEEETSPEDKENELKEETASAQVTDDGKSSSTDPSTIIINEPGILSSQEKEKVQASPLKRLLSGSKKRPKKQRSRRSSDAKLSDSGEQDQMPSAESPENQKEEGPTQPSADAAGEEDSAWASFKKLMTPKKLLKRSSLSNEETQIAVPAEEPKANEGEQISDHSTEEGKKRKDSSVSWEAVLCGSGRRRSRKTSDSEDETPQADNEGGSKHAAESPLESSNENEIVASSPKQAGSPSEGDGGSTWKSLKKLVTPKRKAKDEDESKDNIQSDSEVTQDESSFSIKKLLPGRKKRKSVEKQDQVSSDEADKDVVSVEEDSETPAVVPLSEFDTADAEVHIQTQADIESHIPEEESHELQKDLLDQMAEPVPPCDSLQIGSEEVQDNDALEKSAAPATDEEPDDLTESISKHQQLSDIPEEGIISDTMVTPASFNEEAARDDTIAEDLIEITSEAITAPEPASDITLPDETEMISAVSQLSSESSKTSGNTTPVPAEYDVVETDTLLNQVVETISITPESVPVFSDEQIDERIAGTVSHQILETFVEEQPTILEAHRRSDATAIRTGLNAEELDTINALTATPQTESISEVNDSISTEIVSEVPTEEFDTAEITIDEVYEVTCSEEDIKELERTDESQFLVEGLSEAATTDIPEDEETVPGTDSLVEAHHAETETPKTDSQEADTAAELTTEDMSAAETVTSELKEETEVNVEPEKEDELETEAVKTEEDVQVPEDSEAVEASTLDSEESSGQSPKEEVISEDTAPAETVTDEPKETAEHVQEPELLEAVQEPTIDSELDSVQSVEKEVMSDDVPEEGTVTEEPKEETIPLNEVNLEPVDASKTEDVQVPEESEAVEASSLDSEESSGQSPKEEVISEDIPPAETVTEEPKETTEHVQEPEVLEAVQAPTIDSEVDSVQSVEKEVMSDDVPEEGTVTDEPKEETIHEVSLEPVDASKTEDVQVSETSEAVQASTLDSEESSVQSPKDDVQSEDIPQAETDKDEPKQTEEDVQEPEVIEAAQAPTIDSEEGKETVKSEDIAPEETVKSEDIAPEETVKSEDIAPEETATDEPKQTAEDVQEPEVIEAVRAPTIDSEDGKDTVKSEDIALAETATDEPKQTAEHVQEPEVIEAAQAPTVDSEELKETVKSEDIEPAETATDEPKQTAEDVQEPEVIEAAEAPTVDSEEEKETVKLEDIVPAETATDEPKQTAEDLTEVSAETKNNQLPVNSVKTEQDQESEVLEAFPAPTLHSEGGSVQSLEKETRPEDIPAVETITAEPQKEDAPVEAAETDIQESKVLPSDELETETKTVEEVPMQVVTESTEGGSAQEDTPKPDNNNASALLTDETASEVLAQLVHEITEDQKTESTPQDVTVKQEDCIPEVADELPALTAVHVCSVNEETSSVTDLGKAVLSGETSAPCLDNAAVTEEPELQLSSVEVNEEQEKEGVPPGTEINSATVEHAVVAQVVVCNIKDVPVAIPDVLIEKTSDVTEPLIDTMASQLAFEEEVEAAAPLVRNDVAQTAKEGSVVTTMHVPSVTIEDNHRIQVQEVDVDITSTETIVDSVLEVGVTESKEVIDVCHETVERVDDLSATPETEKEVFHEENKVNVQEVIQHVKENLPETVSESVPEQEVIIQPDAVTKETETEDSIAPAAITAESANEGQVSEENLPETVPESVPENLEQEVIKESDAVTKETETEDSTGKTLREEQDEAPAVITDDSANERQVSEENLPETVSESVPENLEQEVIKESDAVTKETEIGETLREEQDEAPAVITDDSAKDRQVSEELTQATIAEGLDVLIHDHKVDMEETKTEQEKPEGVTAEEVKPSETQIAQIGPIVTASNTGLVVPQNTGIISSIGNVESPSSLSLEFKLNIQFGQAKAPTSPPPPPATTERAAPVKQTDVSEVGVQAVEEVEPVNPTEITNGLKKTELAEVSVQATETTESLVIMTQPVLLDAGVQAIEPVDQIKSSEAITSSVQATETREPAENLTERALIMTEPLQLDVGSQAIETVEPVEQIKPTERVTSTVQATEATQVRPAEKRELLSCDQETKAEQPVKQTEEESEQDVWMDAEEVIYTQEETEQSFVEAEEPQEPQTASEPEEQAGPEVGPDSKTETEESLQETHKTGGTCEIESEAEDFAVAPEYQEVSSASVSKVVQSQRDEKKKKKKK